MLELGVLDLEEIATALQDQDAWDHCCLIDPQSGQIGFWTEDGGIDGRTPVDLEELDLIPIEPLPSWVWYRDMADFAEGISDERAGRSLATAIEGKARSPVQGSPALELPRPPAGLARLPVDPGKAARGPVAGRQLPRRPARRRGCPGQLRRPRPALNPQALPSSHDRVEKSAL